MSIPKCYAPRAFRRTESISYRIQSVLQGACIVAKARKGADVIQESLAHFRRYIQLFLKPAR
jgi:TetR/AcrR family transcriptional regulator, transcriptional repressor for nem operon